MSSRARQFGWIVAPSKAMPGCVVQAFVVVPPLKQELRIVLRAEGDGVELRAEEVIAAKDGRAEFEFKIKQDAPKGKVTLLAECDIGEIDGAVLEIEDGKGSRPIGAVNGPHTASPNSIALSGSVIVTPYYDADVTLTARDTGVVTDIRYPPIYAPANQPTSASFEFDTGAAGFTYIDGHAQRRDGGGSAGDVYPLDVTVE